MRKISTLKFNVHTYRPELTTQQNSTSNFDENAMFQAPDHCVQTIMNFAKSYKVAETKIMGKVEMVIN